MPMSLVKIVEVTILNDPKVGKKHLHFSFSPTQPVILRGPVECLIFQRGIAEAMVAAFAVDIFDVDVRVIRQPIKEE